MFYDEDSKMLFVALKVGGKSYNITTVMHLSFHETAVLSRLTPAQLMSLALAKTYPVHCITSRPPGRCGSLNLVAPIS